MAAQHDAVDMYLSITNANRQIGECFVVEVIVIDGSRRWRHNWKQQYLSPLCWLKRAVFIYRRRRMSEFYLEAASGGRQLFTLYGRHNKRKLGSKMLP